MVEANQDMQNIMNNTKMEKKIGRNTYFLKNLRSNPNDAILASIACFNVFLLRGLLLWM